MCIYPKLKIDQSKLHNKEKLTYYIDKSIGEIKINRFPVIQYGTIQSDDIIIYSVAHNQLYSEFIRTTIQRLDDIIDLDFEISAQSLIKISDNLLAGSLELNSEYLEI